jgi:hypothetical protein
MAQPALLDDGCHQLIPRKGPAFECDADRAAEGIDLLRVTPK